MKYQRKDLLEISDEVEMRSIVWKMEINELLDLREECVDFVKNVFNVAIDFGNIPLRPTYALLQEIDLVVVARHRETV